jgi:phenylacetate-CoA ligase
VAFVKKNEEFYAPTIELATHESWRAYQDELASRAFVLARDHAKELERRLRDSGISLGSVDSVSELGSVPVLSKDALPELQAEDPPFGGLLAVAKSELRRVYCSPGPIFDPEGDGPDYWGFAPALFAAGFRPGASVYNTFSYHLTPAGAMMEEAAFALGCTVVPGGVGATEAQAEFLSKSGASCFCGTPSFLLVLCDRVRHAGHAHSLERAFVSGAPLSESLRAELEEQEGISVLQGYGTADAGALGYECTEKNGWHVAPGRVIEIVDPASGKRLPDGRTGEVVVTSPNEVYPLVRFGTGDLSAIASDACACGRTTPRLLGFQGRVGEGVKVRGQFVHPRSIERGLLRACDSVPLYRAVVTAADHRDELVVRVAAEGVARSSSEAELAKYVSEELRLRVEVHVVPTGQIEESAPLIRDDRRWT